MNYEIVNLEEKKIVGISGRTNNTSPDMGTLIGGLWQRFYQKGICQAIEDKKNDKALGVYMEYAGDEKADYTVMVASETGQSDCIPEGTVSAVIPAGRYAKFIIIGDMYKAVAEFWCRLWDMDLPRSFVCDFEEYQNCDMEQAEIHMYIGLKDE